MPARQAQVLFSLSCILLLVSCRDQGSRPDTESAAIPPSSQALSSLEGTPANHIGESPDIVQERPLPAASTQADYDSLTPAGEASPAAKGPPPTPRFSRKSEVYDRRGQGFALLQSPKSAMKRFPADAQGRVDWVATLAKGLIQPRSSLSKNGTMKRRFDDIVMKETRDMPWVKFPHAQHTEWLDCSNCHPRPFSERKGTNQISMETIMRGQHCGTCHDRVAFSIFACERCHSIPHAGSPAKWW